MLLVVAILGCLPTWVPVLSGQAAGYYRWDLWQMKPREGILNEPVITEDDEKNEGFSACILTMDDSMLWPEWLAYHYQTLPLRRLIVALDPKSKTKPTQVFARYRKHGLPLNVTVWEDDEFLPHENLKRQIQPNTAGGNTLGKYLLRQEWFLHKCLEQLYAENRTWVLLVDTDEFLAPQWQNLIVLDEEESPTKVSTKPRNVFEMVTKYRNQTFSVNGNVKHSQWLDDISQGCLYLDRKRFIPSPNETSMLTSKDAVPYPLLTMEQDRWFHQYNGKVMLDLSKLSPAVAHSIFKNASIGEHTSPHMGLDVLCKPMRLANAQSPFQGPFAAHHYANPLSWALGRSHDPRYQDKLKSAMDDRKKATKFHNHTDLPFATAWVDGFVKRVTKEVALELLLPVENLTAFSNHNTFVSN